MAERITFADVFTVLKEIVDTELEALDETARVFPGVPPDNTVPKPTSFIVIRPIGGLSETFVTATPLITVEGYANKRAEAYRLCDLALSIIRAQDGAIRGARGFSYPQNLPDPTTSQARFTSTGEVRVWGAVHP